MKRRLLEKEFDRVNSIIVIDKEERVLEDGRVVIEKKT
jgi:hypothetical protein